MKLRKLSSGWVESFLTQKPHVTNSNEDNKEIPQPDCTYGLENPHLSWAEMLQMPPGGKLVNNTM